MTMDIWIPKTVHLVIKDGINNDHAVSKQQLDTLEQNTKNAIITAINRDDDQNH